MNIVILTDFHRGSYKVIGELYQNILTPFHDIEHLPTPKKEQDRITFAERFPSGIVLHNTLGKGFIPIDGCYNVAIPHHEWSEYPIPWIHLLDKFDEVWTTTNHVKQVLDKAKLKRPCFFIPPVLDQEQFIPKNDWKIEGTPCFYFVGEAHFRKAHHLLMQGFMNAFPQVGKARLTIKTSPSCSWSSPREDIIIIKKEWSRAKLLAEYSRHDCFISASLGEGLGLPVAEAIMAELPICTNFWGGHKSLLTRNGFIEIPHEEIIQPFTSDPAFYAENQKCAYSSPKNIKNTIKKFLKTSQTERKEITQIAKEYFLKTYGRENALKNIESRLVEINQK